MAATKPRSVFGEQLRRELDRQNLSVNKLAKRIDPQAPEIARRSLTKWIAGKHSPTRASRARVARALGVDPSMFDDGDDEEDEELVRDLLSIIRRVARQEAVPA